MQVRRAGAALVLVLVVSLLLGLAAMSLAFTVTLDSLAARNVQEAALAEGQAEGALALAVAAVVAAPPEARVAGLRLGPWPAEGLSALVDVVQAGGGWLRLESRAVVGRSTSTRSVSLRITSTGVPQVLDRP